MRAHQRQYFIINHVQNIATVVILSGTKVLPIVKRAQAWEYWKAPRRAIPEYLSFLKKKVVSLW